MYTKDGWLSARGVKILVIVCLVSAILSTLNSCNSTETVYYLQVNDYNEETVCINIVDQNDVIICVLDRNVDCHSDPQSIINEINDGQIGFTSIFIASTAYWDLVKQE